MNNKRTSQYIALFDKIDRRNTCAVLGLSVVQALFFSVETILIAGLIDNIISSLSDKNGAVFGSVLALLAFWILRRLLTFLYGNSAANLQKSADTAIPLYLFHKKSRLSYRTMEQQEVQELMRRIESDTSEKTYEYFENNISLMETFLECAGLLALVMYKNVWIGVILFLVLIPYAVFSVKNGRFSYEAYEESEELFRRADYFQSVMKDRSYMEERTLFQYGLYFQKKWLKKYRDAIQIEKNANLHIFAKSEGINICSTILIGVIAFLLLLTVRYNSVTLGFFIALIKSMIQFIDTTSTDFAKRMRTYETGKLFLRDLTEFQNLEEESDDRGIAIAGKEETDDHGIAIAGKEESDDRGTEIAGKEQADDNGIKFDGENKADDCCAEFDETVEHIEFRDVTFAYPGSETCIFDHLSLTLDGGRQYALVGDNGAGKSTLLKLLMGFYDNYTGEILINGRDIRSISRASLRNLFSFVPQQIAKYELRLDEYLKTDDREKIRDVFSRLGISDIRFEEEFPQFGKIEENGIDLSGGQWQLLAIARAVLDNRAIYILDEPTAAIDPVREARLYELFQEIMKTKFTILVTHRLGAARMSDEIIVLRDGAVREKGSHAALMQQGGIYQTMYNTQRKWYE
jgi:ATP-binding cassette subfamily B protein